jgi:hypothetical protein
MSLEILQRLPPQIIYLLIMIALIVPYFTPLGLPLTISEETKAVYALIETLPTDKPVVLSLGSHVTWWLETGGMVDILWRHLIMRGIKTIGIVTSMESEVLWPRELERIGPLLDEHGYEYGIDYAIFPMLIGDEPGYAAFSEDFSNVFSYDLWGKPIAEIPLIANLPTKSAADYSCLFDITDGFGSTQSWVRQAKQPYGTKIVCAPYGAVLSSYYPYYTAGTFDGLLPSIRGASEYQVYMDIPMAEAASMDSQSLVHLFVVIFLVVGNIGYFAAKGRVRKE